MEVSLLECDVALGHSSCHALRRGPPLQGRVLAPEHRGPAEEHALVQSPCTAGAGACPSDREGRRGRQWPR
eukprot:7410266-Heterocapsa_arctica.AAC.1